MSSQSVARLDRFAKLTTTIRDQIESNYLFPHRRPQWAWPEDQSPPLGRVGRRLHRLYTPPKLVAEIIPVQAIPLLGLFVTVLVLRWTYPLFLAVIVRVPWFSGPLSYEVVGLKLLIALLLLVLFGIGLGSAVGSYWVLLELTANRHLSFSLRVTTLIIVLVVAGAQVVAGQFWISEPLPYSPSETGDPLGLERTAGAIQDSLAYRIIASAVILFPVLSCSWLLMIRWFITGVFFSWAAGHWLLKFHSLSSAAKISEFVKRPLPIGEETETTLLELDEKDIDALLEWSLCRREAIQNRLVPATLVIGVLGVLANTWVDPVAGLALDITKDYLRVPRSLGDLATKWRFLALSFVVSVPIAVIFPLLNEAFKMDFVAQASLLARYAKRSPIGEDRELDRWPRRSGCLVWLSQRLFGARGSREEDNE